VGGAQNGRRLTDNRKPLTKGVGTPDHIIPVDGNPFNRSPNNTTVLGSMFDLAPAKRERDARIVK